MKKLIFTKKISTPIGEMLACATEDALCMLEYADKKGLQKELDEVSQFFHTEISSESNHILDSLEQQLSQYFSGKRQNFDVPLVTVGTDFQKKVWDSLLQIPFGSTKSYSKQAENLGSTRAVRAVANANGQNKINILIPCHRVIGSNGKLTGYGGGVWRKQKLLELEKSILF